MSTALKLTPLEQAQEPLQKRDYYYAKLMKLYVPFVTKFPDTKIQQMLVARYQTHEVRYMTLEQVRDLVQFMEERVDHGKSYAN